MAAATTDSQGLITGSQEKPRTPPAAQPPTCYMTTGPSSLHFGGLGSDPGCYQNAAYNGHLPMGQPGPGPTVMVTQPVVVAGPNVPNTSCALVMSVISAIFCGFWCGTAGILLAWKAKLLVLEQKYEHARHSLRVVWLFLLMAVVFGTLVWGSLAIVLFIASRSRYYNPYY